jgi:hypothetical protein
MPITVSVVDRRAEFMAALSLGGSRLLDPARSAPELTGGARVAA